MILIFLLLSIVVFPSISASCPYCPCKDIKCVTLRTNCEVETECDCLALNPFYSFVQCSPPSPPLSNCHSTCETCSLLPSPFPSSASCLTCPPTHEVFLTLYPSFSLNTHSSPLLPSPLLSSTSPSSLSPLSSPTHFCVPKRDNLARLLPVCLHTHSPKQTPLFTLSFYFHADNDLESFFFKDLHELLLSSSPSNLLKGKFRFLLFVDKGGALEDLSSFLNRFSRFRRPFLVDCHFWHESKNRSLLEDLDLGISPLIRPDFSLSYLFELIYDGRELWLGTIPGTPELEEMMKGEVNMASEETLLQFLLSVKDIHQASEKAGLVLWNHGGAYKGIGGDGDGIHVKSSFPISAISKTIKNSNLKLDILVLDMCLMSHYDVLLSFAPLASYIIASELSVPSSGLYYTFQLEERQFDVANFGKEWIKRTEEATKKMEGIFTLWESSLLLSLDEKLHQILNFHFPCLPFGKALLQEALARTTVLRQCRIVGINDCIDGGHYFSNVLYLLYDIILPSSGRYRAEERREVTSLIPEEERAKTKTGSERREKSQVSSEEKEKDKGEKGAEGPEGQDNLRGMSGSGDERRGAWLENRRRLEEQEKVTPEGEEEERREKRENLLSDIGLFHTWHTLVAVTNFLNLYKEARLSHSHHVYTGMSFYSPLFLLNSHPSVSDSAEVSAEEAANMKGEGERRGWEKSYQFYEEHHKSSQNWGIISLSLDNYFYKKTFFFKNFGYCVSDYFLSADARPNETSSKITQDIYQNLQQILPYQNLIGNKNISFFYAIHQKFALPPSQIRIKLFFDTPLQAPSKLETEKLPLGPPKTEEGGDLEAVNKNETLQMASSKSGEKRHVLLTNSGEILGEEFFFYELLQNEKENLIVTRIIRETSNKNEVVFDRDPEFALLFLTSKESAAANEVHSILVVHDKDRGDMYLGRVYRQCERNEHLFDKKFICDSIFDAYLRKKDNFDEIYIFFDKEQETRVKISPRLSSKILFQSLFLSFVPSPVSDFSSPDVPAVSLPLLSRLRQILELSNQFLKHFSPWGSISSLHIETHQTLPLSLMSLSLLRESFALTATLRPNSEPNELLPFPIESSNDWFSSPTTEEKRLTEEELHGERREEIEGDREVENGEERRQIVEDEMTLQTTLAPNNSSAGDVVKEEEAQREESEEKGEDIEEEVYFYLFAVHHIPSRSVYIENIFYNVEEQNSISSFGKRIHQKFISNKNEVCQDFYSMNICERSCERSPYFCLGRVNSEAVSPSRPSKFNFSPSLSSVSVSAYTIGPFLDDIPNLKQFPISYAPCGKEETEICSPHSQCIKISSVPICICSGSEGSRNSSAEHSADVSPKKYVGNGIYCHEIMTMSNDSSHEFFMKIPIKNSTSHTIDFPLFEEYFHQILRQDTLENSLSSLDQARIKNFEEHQKIINIAPVIKFFEPMFEIYMKIIKPSRNSRKVIKNCVEILKIKKVASKIEDYSHLEILMQTNFLCLHGSLLSAIKIKTLLERSKTHSAETSADVSSGNGGWRLSAWSSRFRNTIASKIVGKEEGDAVKPEIKFWFDQDNLKVFNFFIKNLQISPYQKLMADLTFLMGIPFFSSNTLPFTFLDVFFFNAIIFSAASLLLMVVYFLSRHLITIIKNLKKTRSSSPLPPLPSSPSVHQDLSPSQNNHQKKKKNGSIKNINPKSAQGYFASS